MVSEICFRTCSGYQRSLISPSHHTTMFRKFNEIVLFFNVLYSTECSPDSGQPSFMIGLFLKISCWMFSSTRDSSWLLSPFKYWRHFFTLALSISTLSLLLSSVSSCGMNMQIKFWFLFLILCAALRTSDYRLPLFLFSNFAKQVYSLASQGMCKVRVRLCLKPIQQWKKKVQKSQ